jgi:hypothetical protein
MLVIDGHTLSVISGQGVALLPDQVAPTSYVATIDYIHGNGTAIFYSDLAFSDGSVLWMKAVNGQATVKGKTTEFQIPITIVGGKGRYAGAKGEGMGTGMRMQPLPGQGAEIVNDFK